MKSIHHALKRQQDALHHLKTTPSPDNEPLIHLLHERDDIDWGTFEPAQLSEKDWAILKDPEFDGCDKQREFVTKALATTDFAILDGPPGTGKTTTILELIIQLVRQNKRVLLTASTHAAINNVLERIEALHLTNEIFPLRIGDENKAMGVEQFQYDNLKHDLNKATAINEEIDRLMVDSSNLICGTTMGILKLLGSDKLVDSSIPPFDVMIIDECSKTTFAEFLVPARYAKRWVLVGDVKQLSPFTDREQITANLEQIVIQHPNHRKGIKEKTLSHATQTACFLLSTLCSKENHQWGYHDQLVIPVTAPELEALHEEIQTRVNAKQSGFDSICLVGKAGAGKQVNTLTKDKLQQQPWLLYEYNLLFCDRGLLNTIYDWLPDDSIILAPQWLTSSHAFRHQRHWDDQHRFNAKGRERLSKAKDIHQSWKVLNQKSSWAEEVVWRLEREYWLRFLGQPKRHIKQHNKARGIEQQLKRLMPYSINATGKVYTLRNMAFPSILEALSGSGTLKQNHETANTLNQGFEEEEKTCRHTTLTYQHRMHPDISTFPRDQFYSKDKEIPSLLDGSQTLSSRCWNYSVRKAGTLA